MQLEQQRGGPGHMRVAILVPDTDPKPVNGAGNAPIP
jgi:hypothetical protein